MKLSVREWKNVAYTCLVIAAVAMGHHVYYIYTHIDQTNTRNFVENWPSLLVFAIFMGIAQFIIRKSKKS